MHLYLSALLTRWCVLEERGLTKERMESWEQPITGACV